MVRPFLPLVMMLGMLVGVDAVIDACVDSTTGSLRIVTSGQGCGQNEAKLQWGQAGEQGEPGPSGPQGPPGVSDIGCTTNQIARWNDEQAQWTCADLPDTAALEQRIADLESLLQDVSRSGDTLVISGANLQVVNGTGSTEETNGLGNLIIGYNESRQDPAEDDRSGSHMLVAGSQLNYSSYGGIVTGLDNTVSGSYSAAVAGADNLAGCCLNAVLGGSGNAADGRSAVVVGGTTNSASGNAALVAGGLNNTANGDFNASAFGGESNSAAGTLASAYGGQEDLAQARRSAVLGGYANSTVQPDANNNTSGSFATVVVGESMQHV